MTEVRRGLFYSMFPSKRGIFWNGTSGGHNKKRIFSTLTQRNTPAGPRPSPTQGKKTLSRYLTSDTCLSHLLPKDGALHWEDVPVGVHGAVGQCWSWVPQSWNDCGMTLIHTGGFGGGSSGASCIKPCQLRAQSIWQPRHQQDVTLRFSVAVYP